MSLLRSHPSFTSGDSTPVLRTASRRKIVSHRSEKESPDTARSKRFAESLSEIQYVALWSYF